MSARWETPKTAPFGTGEIMSVHRSNEPYSIGVLSHGPKLKEAIESGEMEPFFSELAFLYRDIYGGPPWNEYLICSNPECKKKSGLPEGKTLEIADAKLLKNTSECVCGDCQAPLKLFYEPGRIMTNLRNVFRQKIFASILFDPQIRMAGFSLGWETTVRDGYRDKMIIGAGDESPPAMTYTEYLRELRQVLGREYDEETPTFNSAEWAISPRARGSKASIPVLHAIYCEAQNKISEEAGKPIPVVGHTLVGSKALSIFERVGFSAGKQKKGSDEVRVYSTLPKLIRGTATNS